MSHKQEPSQTASQSSPTGIGVNGRVCAVPSCLRGEDASHEATERCRRPSRPQDTPGETRIAPEYDRVWFETACSWEHTA